MVDRPVGALQIGQGGAHYPRDVAAGLMVDVVVGLVIALAPCRCTPLLIEKLSTGALPPILTAA